MEYNEKYQGIIFRAATSQSFAMKELVDQTYALLANKSPSALNYRDFVVNILAYVFAYWSLQDGFDVKSETDIGATAESRNEFFKSFKQPHSAQV